MVGAHIAAVFAYRAVAKKDRFKHVPGYLVVIDIYLCYGTL